MHLASGGGCSGQLAGGGIRAEAHGLEHPLRGVQEWDVRERRAQCQRAQLCSQPHACRCVIHCHHARSVIRLRVQGCPQVKSETPYCELYFRLLMYIIAGRPLQLVVTTYCFDCAEPWKTCLARLRAPGDIGFYRMAQVHLVGNSHRRD